MFTLIYNKGQFNRPDTLVPFLQSNVGEYPLLQVDCVTPFPGSKDDLERAVCEYLSKIIPDISLIILHCKSMYKEQLNTAVKQQI